MDNEMKKLKRSSHSRLESIGLPCITSKLQIGACDVYLKTTWSYGKIFRIDITISRGQGDIDNTAYYLARAWVEDSCRMASELLDMGAPIEKVIRMWKGVEGFPSGACPQVQQLVNGPLHAVAVHIEQRQSAWRADILARDIDVEDVEAEG